MKQRFSLSIILFFILNSLVGQTIENPIVGCDTLTGEIVIIDQSNLVQDCCYRWDGTNLVKTNGTGDCSNVVIGECEQPALDKQCWAVVTDNPLCDYNLAGFQFVAQVSMTGQPYPVFVTQLHIDEFFVNGAVIPLPNYPYITSTSNDPQLLADVETWLNNNGYNAIVNADQILIDSDNLELEFCGDAFLYELNSGGGFTGNTTQGQEDLCLSLIHI